MTNPSLELYLRILTILPPILRKKKRFCPTVIRSWNDQSLIRIRSSKTPKYSNCHSILEWPIPH